MTGAISSWAQAGIPHRVETETAERRRIFLKTVTDGKMAIPEKVHTGILILSFLSTISGKTTCRKMFKHLPIP
jgi:hypothetical protein